MRKLAMVLSVVGLVCPVAAGVAGTGQPLPPIQPGPQGAQMVVKGFLSNYVAPTATLNGSVDVATTSPRIVGRQIQKTRSKLRVVLTPQTTIRGVIVNGRPGIVKIKRQSQWIHGRLAALEVVTIGEGTQDEAIPAGGTPINPDADPDDGTSICSEEECAAQQQLA